MDPLEDTHEEFEKLKSEEGVAAFIAEKSGLDYERVLRIYRWDCLGHSPMTRRGISADKQPKPVLMSSPAW
ncbi:MAG: hypothetical protein ABI980_11420 [Nitrospirota bacterium]